jgi:hypothetical protein
MRNKLLQLSGCAVFLFIAAGQAGAQGTDNYGGGLKINLDTSGKKFVRFLTWHQVWVRYNENNPGSAINGTKTENQWDMSLRRSRFLVYSQINPDFLILTHFGINNANQVSGGGVGQGVNLGSASVDGKKPQLFIHDAWVEHRIFRDVVSIGAGLHYWQGPSRLAGASTMNFLGLDSPVFSWQNIDATDQFARQYGLYLKGKLLKNRRLDYRAALNFPFALPGGSALGGLDTLSARRDVPATAYRLGGQPRPAYTGYFSYQFLDIESNLLPFNVGSYLGTKRVFNIGAGFYHHQNAMWTARRNTGTNRIDTAMQSQVNVSVDAFLDMPLDPEKKMALTAYLSYNYMDFGSNFVRSIGIDNPANGSIAGQVTYNGAGNAVPLIGTGHVYFVQAGLLLPKIKRVGRFQPYASAILASYERLADPVLIPDIGMNWHLAGHSAKLTFNYRLRPVFAYDTPGQRWSQIHKSTSRNELTIQFHIYL